MPFMGSDKSVVQRTQYFMFKYRNDRPVQYEPYYTIESLASVFKVIIWAISFSFLSNSKFGRRLLQKVKLYKHNFIFLRRS